MISNFDTYGAGQLTTVAPTESLTPIARDCKLIPSWELLWKIQLLRSLGFHAAADELADALRKTHPQRADTKS